MEVNFANKVTNVNIKFDSNNSYTAMGNSSFWVHGHYWNGTINFPYGATKVSVEDSRMLNKQVVIPQGVSDMSNAFQNCYVYNYPTTLSSSARNFFSTFRNCYNFNQPVSIWSWATNCAFMFANCINYNQGTLFSDGVVNTAYALSNCRNFNNSVSIGSTVQDLAYMFSNCVTFNQSVTLPANATNVSGMFDYARSFNRPITLTANVTNCAYMFNYVGVFNQAVTFPSNIKNTYYMLNYCSYFNSPITIPNSSSASLQNFGPISNFNRAVTIPSLPSLSRIFGGLNDTKYGNVMSFYSNRNLAMDIGITSSSFNGWIRPMVSDAWNIVNQNSSYNLKTNVVLNYVNFYASRSVFNRPVTIESGVYYTNRMFYLCAAYNQPTTIPYTVRNAISMFESATAFNSSVTMGSNMQNCGWMFKQASSFNQAVTIPQTATDCQEMFCMAYRFNQSVTIPNNVTSCRAMFSTCPNFNRSVSIGTGVTDCTNMFYDCTNFNSSVSFANPYSSLAYNSIKRRMFCNCTNLSFMPFTTLGLDCAYIFYNCQNMRYTGPINISTWYANYAFYRCRNININWVNITSPYEAYANLSAMFYDCRGSSFSDGIYINEGPEDLSAMFQSCYNLNGPVYIPNSATNCAFMLESCGGVKDIYVRNVANNQFYCCLAGDFNAVRHIIHTDSASYQNLRSTYLVYGWDDSIGQTTAILPKWTSVTNGCQNSLYNIRILNNY